MSLGCGVFKLFEIDKKNYLWIAETGALYELDELSKMILYNSCKDGSDVRGDAMKQFNISEETFNNALKELETALAYQEKNTNILTFSENKLNGIELMVCQCCNLNCDYCYGESGEYQNKGKMALSTAVAAVDYLFNHSTKSNVGISFFGGEPLMNYPLICDITAYAKNKAISNNRSVQFSITTNGTLITEEIAKFLKENSFYVSLSIDGNESGHNIHRVYKNGEGSYKKVVCALEKLKGNHILIRATSTPDNMNYAQISQSLFAIGKTEYYITEARQYFNSDVLYKKLFISYCDAIDYFIENLHKGDYIECKANALIYRGLKRIAHPQRVVCNCEALINSIAVDIEGKIYPCHRFVGTDYSLGNIEDNGVNIEAINSLFQSHFVFENRTYCKKCWAKLLCRGECPYNHYVGKSNGTERYCEFTRAFYEKLMMLYLSLGEKEKKILDL